MFKCFAHIKTTNPCTTTCALEGYEELEKDYSAINKEGAEIGF